MDLGVDARGLSDLLNTLKNTFNILLALSHLVVPLQMLYPFKDIQVPVFKTVILILLFVLAPLALTLESIFLFQELLSLKNIGYRVV